MSLRVKLEFEGTALETPANRDLVEHLAKVLTDEATVYVVTHGGGGVNLGPPRHVTDDHKEVAIGAAGAGWRPVEYTVHRALVEGSVHLNRE